MKKNRVFIEERPDIPMPPASKHDRICMIISGVYVLIIAAIIVNAILLLTNKNYMNWQIIVEIILVILLATMPFVRKIMMSQYMSIRLLTWEEYKYYTTYYNEEGTLRTPEEIEKIKSQWADSENEKKD